MSGELQNHVRASEPYLLFGRDPASDRHIHPLLGLLEFGPYSTPIFPREIRIATLAPQANERALFRFMQEFSTPIRAKERQGYLEDWHGFDQTFRTHLRAAPKNCRTTLPASFDDELIRSSSGNILLLDTLKRAIMDLCAYRAEFDVLFIYLPVRWKTLFVHRELDFDLHDELKAFTAVLGVPIQIVREDSAISYRDQASVMWRLGLAIYAKSGGIPWKLASIDDDTAFIGISYALKGNAEDNERFVTCCSQVFDNHGTGLEFVAYNAADVRVFQRNPFLSREQMFRVMTRCLELYRRRHAGSVPRRIIVHKSTEFKRAEVDGALAALHLCKQIDLIQVVENTGWRGIAYDSREGPSRYPVERGTLLGLGNNEALLWTHGRVDGSSRRPYFQGGKSTPKPLKLVRHAGTGSWEAVARSTLGLTKMNWNNDALYDALPVTLVYSSILSNVIKRIPNLRNDAYQFRYFI
ncbi:argonaute/piwi family protein [Pelagerythrobacter aerophilus]